MTDMEYSRNERSISSWISMGSMDPLDRVVAGRGTVVAVRPDACARRDPTARVD